MAHASLPSRPARGTRQPERRLVTGVAPEKASPAAVAREFRALLAAGARLRPAGTARADASVLLGTRYVPRYEIRLFDARYFLAPYRFDDALGFFVAYVVLGARPDAVWPRIFYKDASLVWRVASHVLRDGDGIWIGKGDVRLETRGAWTWRHSAEETTNLPHELQFALDELSRRNPVRRDAAAIALVARAAPRGRIEPYADFSAPRRRAAALHAENGGRPVARFLRRGEPESLVFARGYEPDFARGLLERGRVTSRFYGGRVTKHRVLAVNRRVQYLFLAGPRHVWIAPPQLLTTELSSYGVRTHEVRADEDLFVPGYEYHDGLGDTQIPAGYAGALHGEHPDRADASAWLERLPVVRAFRATVLRRGARTRG